MPVTSIEGDIWVDIDPVIAKPNIQDNLNDYRQSADLLKKRLSQPGYRDKAPKELVEQTEHELEEMEILASVLENLLKSLEG